MDLLVLGLTVIEKQGRSRGLDESQRQEHLARFELD
jgi:hypothetical protein